MAPLSNYVLRDTRANQPAAGTAGRLYYVTDENVLERDSGSAWQNIEGAPAGGGGDMIKLTAVVLGSDTANFDFTSISGAYTHLRIVGQLRSTESATGSTANLRFNNDSGANYDSQYEQLTNTTIGAGSTIAGTSGYFGNVPAASSPSGSAGYVVIDIPNYAATVFHKAYVAHVIGKRGTSADHINPMHVGGFWRDTSAITRITIFPGSGNWLTGSMLSLYGIN